ncbi:MAG TPA: FG-GAP-like repeat-containing protein [Terracidiphilus sp.]|nr:FG-GAP-like repeat-containing protein [Terracidiphilus sp.]
MRQIRISFRLAAWLIAATLSALAAGAVAQKPNTDSGPAPVPTGAQVGMASQISPSTQAAPLSQSEIDDNVAAPTARLPHGEGARRMGARLRKYFSDSDWKADPSKPRDRIPYYELLLTRRLSLQDEMIVRMELGNEQLRAGRSAQAVDTLEALVKTMDSNLERVPRTIQAQVHQELALAYLRLGEQENCIGMHNPMSCILPLRGGAVHRQKRGAEGAVREYTKVLELNPDSYIARWLLNIAYMQLGRYPQDVPKQWLAPPEKFDSEFDIGYFPDVAAIAGIYADELSGGAIVEDFDGDGLLDIMISSSGPVDPMHFFHNNGDGTFTDRTKEAGLADEVGGLNMVLTDYNNDGCPDVLVLRGAWWGPYGQYPLSLLKNNCNGTFDDVTEEAGLMTAHPGQAAAWADYDGDGWLDLFVGHESKGTDVHPSQLFHNNHDGTFTLVKAPNAAPGKRGVNLGFVKGVAWGDYNNDGRPDLYVSTMFGRSFLFRNDGPRDPKHPETGDWIFTDVTEQAGLGGKRYTFPTWFFDYDNDGWLDIFAGGYSTTSMEDVGLFEFGKPNKASVSHLFHNNHDGTFTDVPNAAGLNRSITNMAGNFGDLDNDGWLDVFLGVGESSYECLLAKPMFRNDRGKYFQDVTTSGGFGNLQKGHGIAFADIENNGNDDVFEELGGAFQGDRFMPVLYRNLGHGNHWITLRLQGVRTNRAAYGARIRVVIDENGTERSIYRAVGSVSSFGGNPMEQHIGVGKAAVVTRIELWWPVSNTRQQFRNVRVDRVYKVREDRNVLQPVQRKTFEFGKQKIAMPAEMHMHGDAMK